MSQVVSQRVLQAPPALNGQPTGSPVSPTPSAPPGRFPAFDPFRSRDFTLLWLSGFTTATATWMDQMARAWLLYDLTGSTIQLGLVGTLRIFPLLFLSPIAGTLADRYGRKTQLVIAQTVNAVANVALALLIIQGGVQPFHVYATGLLTAIAQMFQGPARQAMVPEAVDRRSLTGAVALTSLSFNISRMLGPATAGALMAATGAGGSYLVQAGLFVVSTIWTLQLGLPDRPPGIGRGGNGERSFARSTVDGWSYVARHRTIRTDLILLGVVSFFGFATTSLLPVFTKQVLAATAADQGRLLASMGAGAVLGALLLATRGDRLPKGLVIVGGTAVCGLASAAFAASHWLLLSVALMGVLGLGNVASNALIQTLLQAESAPELRGRVMGIYQQHQVLIAGGGLLAGVLAAIWGVQATVACFGAACTVGAVAVFLASPTIRTIR